MPESSAERMPLRPFPTEDPRLADISHRLNASPDQLPILQGLFSNDLWEQQNQIVGVRSYDIVTLINHVMNGSIQVGGQDASERIMGKRPGWFYMTPVYQNGFYDTRRELVGANPEDFLTTVSNNINLYAGDIAFTTALATNVLPILKPTWQEQARKMLVSLGESAHLPDYPEGLVIEVFADYVKRQLEEVINNLPLPELLRGKGKKFSVLHELLRMIPEDINKKIVLDFLAETLKSRGGIIVGFNEHIFQGNYVSDATDTEGIIHGDPEIAISPPNGVMKISEAIVAIEPLGHYEDNILERLGIIA